MTTNSKTSLPSYDLEHGMRRALGVGSEHHRHKRHFAKDGDVEVVVLRTHTQTSPVGENAQLLAERDRRADAERALTAAQATIRDLQTKLAHLEMAQEELRAALRQSAPRIQELEAAVAEQAAGRAEAEARLAGEVAASRKIRQQLTDLRRKVRVEGDASAVRTPRAHPQRRQAGSLPVEQQPVDWWSKHEKKGWR